jgi:hypothetical protein
MDILQDSLTCHLSSLASAAGKQEGETIAASPSGGLRAPGTMPDGERDGDGESDDGDGGG